MDRERLSRDMALLKRIQDGAASRHQRRDHELKQLAVFDEDAYDFPPEMIPFHKDPRYQAAPEVVRRQICTRAWLAYNRKAVLLEERVVAPACLNLGQSRLFGLPQMSRQSIADVFDEESQHITMLAQANRLTYSFRKLDGLALPLPDIVRQMIVAMDDSASRYEAQLWSLVCAIVAEVSISDYLGQLKLHDERIQKLNRQLTALHRRDELAHAGVFGHLARLLEDVVTSKSQFHSMLRQASAWFHSGEWASWETILQGHPFDGWRGVLDDARKQRQGTALEKPFQRMMRHLKLAA